MRKTANVLFVIAWIFFIVGIVQKILCKATVLGLNPTSYVKFAGICLLFVVTILLYELVEKR